MGRAAALLCFGFLFLSCFIYGQQQVIRGVVTSDDNLDKAVVTIQVYDANFTQIDYLILEGEKTFEIVVDTNYTSVNLVISSLACTPFTQKVGFAESQIIFLPVKLQNCTHELEEVLVTAEQYFIKENGDTLSFEVAGFKKGTDFTLGDVLNRMPGIEIGPNNQILYQGKRVQQIWVQGRDILNNQHSLALEGLKAEDINTIQIIHEYQPFHKRFSQEDSDAVAMNIDMKEKSRGRINGDADLSIGFPGRYNVNAEAVTVKPAAGNATFIRSNNIGEQVIEPVEYLGLVGSFDRLTQQNSGEANVIPSALLPNTEANIQSQYLLTSSTDFDLSEGTRAKASLLGFLKRTEESAVIQTNFFDTDVQFSGLATEQMSFPLLLANFNVRHELSKDLLLEVDVPVEIHEQKHEDERQGEYQESEYVSLLNKKQRLLRLHPRFSLIARHNLNWTSRHHIEYRTEETPSQTTFLGRSEALPDQFQQIRSNGENLILTSSFEHKLNDLWLLEIRNTLGGHRFSTALDTNSLQFNSRLNNSYQQYFWKPGFQYGIKNNHWSVHLGLQLSFHDLTTNERNFRRQWLNPVFRAKYNWHLSKFIGFSIRQEQGFVEQINAFDLSLLEDNLTIRRFMLEPGLDQRTRAFDAYYFNLKKSNGSSFNCTLHYQETTNKLSTFNTFTDDFNVSEVFLARRSQYGAFHLSLSLPFWNKEYLWKPDFKVRFSALDRAPYASILEQQIKWGAQISSAWEGKWNITLNLNHSLLRQRQAELERNLQAWQVGVGGRYNNQNWKVNIDYEWNLNQIGSASFPIHQLHFILERKLTQKWTLIARGIDLLNLDQSQTVSLVNTPAFIEQRVFSRLRGSLLIGIKYSF